MSSVFFSNQCIFGVSRQTLWNAKTCDTKVLGKTTGNYSRQRKIEEKSILEEVFDRLVPVHHSNGSGKAVRIVSKPLLEFYRDYSTIVSESHGYGFVLSYQSFLNHANNYNLRFTSEKSICPHCELLFQLESNESSLQPDEEAKLAKLRIHIKRASAQQKYLQSLITNLDSSAIVVILDFTAIDVITHHFNDLIITVYTKSGHKFYHYVGEIGRKNDVGFVISCLKDLAPLISEFNQAHLWSDGGPKHFKVSSLMNFMIDLQAATSTTITYHFFVSYHGHSSCDAAAGHIKRQLTTSIGSTKTVPRTAVALIPIIESIQNHIGFTAPTVDCKFETIQTLKGIKSYHKYTFENNTIQGYIESTSSTYSCVFIPHTVTKYI